MSLGSEGSCQIGGNLSTNAGGLSVLRYGMMRDLVLGLEVVLADGRVLPCAQALRKDNTGYDVKSLFIGAEGTLGIITAANLKLFPQIHSSATAFVAVPHIDAAVALLAELRAASGERVSSFELVPRIAVELAARHIPEVADPLERAYPWYVLCRTHLRGRRRCARRGARARARCGSGTRRAARCGSCAERAPAAGVLALARKYSRGAAARRCEPEARCFACPSPHSRRLWSAHPPGSPRTFRRAASSPMATWAMATCISISIRRPARIGAAFLAREAFVKRAMHDLVRDFGGSFSAEHGIGQLKVAELERYAPPVELEVMRAIKRALDPHGILNPGKVLQKEHS